MRPLTIYRSHEAREFFTVRWFKDYIGTQPEDFARQFFTTTACEAKEL